MATAEKSSGVAGGFGGTTGLGVAHGAKSFSVELSKIHIDHELNSRKKVSDAAVNAMMESIEAVGGLLSPLVCCPSKPGIQTEQPATLVAGFTRAEALKRLEARDIQEGKDGKQWSANVPIMMLPGIDISDYHTVQLVENLVRNDLNPVEVAEAIERALEESKIDGKPMTAKDLARQTGVSEGKISQYRAIGRLPESILDMISAGEISFTHARIIASPMVPDSQKEKAADTAKGMTASEFEAEMNATYGDGSTQSGEGEGDGATGADGPTTEGGQKARRTRPPKEVAEEYLPELKRQLSQTTDATEQRVINAEIDAVKWMMNEEGTDLAKRFEAFEKAKEEAKKKEEVENDQKKGHDTLMMHLIKGMNTVLNAEVKFGERRPTPAEALATVRKSLEKDYNKQDKTYPVPIGKKKDQEVETVVALPIGDLDSFMGDVHKAWEADVAKKKAAVEQRKAAIKAKKEKEAADAAAAAKGEADTTKAGAAEQTGTPTATQAAPTQS